MVAPPFVLAGDDPPAEGYSIWTTKYWIAEAIRLTGVERYRCQCLEHADPAVRDQSCGPCAKKGPQRVER